MMLDWLNQYSAAIQALSTVVLVVITAWYAVRTHQLATFTGEQLHLAKRTLEPDVKVGLRVALVPSPVPGGPMGHLVELTAANSGVRTVTVSQPVLELEDGRNLVFTNGFYHASRFPSKLEAGEGCQALADMGPILASLQNAGYRQRVKVKAMFKDNLGNSFRSESWDVNIPFLLKSIVEG
jgi:hypothetical protein